MNARTNLLVGVFVGLVVGTSALYIGRPSHGQDVVVEPPVIQVAPGPPIAVPPVLPGASAWRYYAFDSAAQGLLLLDTTRGQLWQFTGSGWRELPAPPAAQRGQGGGTPQQPLPEQSR